ncbi:sugar phosphate nucleotidyltransferase [Streptomyces hygroscopicus]|nr:sugar phosphate nucleotidyltransferase [Streptomyces hygroscopicus]GLV79363.1 mannose-1-phosphate guanyltransferase [Streptomyces hygroscopicus subsp. hygroscopicus]
MKAVVMAGGEGTRLRPMTSNLPKPLLPVGDRPVMEHVLQLLKSHGIHDVVVTVQFLAALIENHFGDGTELGVRLAYAHEDRPLGTAGSVRNARRALGEGTFLVVSGDALTDIDLTRAVQFHREKGALVTVCLTRVADPLEFGITVLDGEGRVERFLEKPTWGQVFTDTVNTGIYIMEPAVLDHVREGESVDWSKDVFPRLLAEGRPVYGYVADGYWEDIGSHDSYAAAQADLLDGKVRAELAGFDLAPGIRVGEGAEVHPEAVLTAPVYIGPHSRIEAKAEIGPHTVVGRGSVVGARAVVERSTLHENVYVGPGALLTGSVLGRYSAVMAGARLEPSVVVGDHSIIGRNAIVACGVRIYPSKTIDEAARVNSSVVWENRAQASLFGPRGVGGILNVDVTPEIAVRLSAAYASTLRKGDTVVLGSDHSRGARALAQCIASALQTGAVDVRDLRSTALPVLRQQSLLTASNGVYVRTAPGEPNSVEILFVDSTGADLSESAQRSLDRVYARQDYRRAFPGEIGSLIHPARTLETYAEALAGTGGDTLPAAGLKVVVDAGHGAAAHVLPALLGRLGVEALVVNTGIKDSRPTETAETRAEDLTRLGELVVSSKAALGVRFDSVGERLTLVNDLGDCVNDAQTALIHLELAARWHGGGRIVLPVSMSRAAEGIAARHGATVHWTGTSRAALTKEAADPATILAVDGAGGFIVPGTGVPFDAAAAFTDLVRYLADLSESLSRIESGLPDSHVLCREIATPWSVKGAVMRGVAESLGDRVLDTTSDGVRIVEPDGGWALVQPDAVHAVTRIWAEGATRDASQRLLDQWAEHVEAATV